MATTIKLKNSVTTTNTPSSLAQGEVAINITDKKVWVGNAATTPIQLLGDGGSVTFTSLTVTGVSTFSAGTVSAPSITTSGDTNTGIYFPAADTIAFTEGGVESMRIDSSGNVGIGTSSISRRLTVSGKAQFTSTTNSNEIYLADTDSSVIDNQYIGSVGNNIRLGTGGSERMRITSDGDVLIGTTSSDQISGIGSKFRSEGRLQQVSSYSTNSQESLSMYSSGASAYRFYVGWGGTIYATSTTISAISDQRLKENIQDIDVGLNAVMALKPRKFDWKEGKGKNKKGDRGWIAQEFEQVFPEMIDNWKDPAPEGEEPYKSVRADLIPVLVKAIQEQQQIINDLKTRIETLESK